MLKHVFGLKVTEQGAWDRISDYFPEQHTTVVRPTRHGIRLDRSPYRSIC